MIKYDFKGFLDGKWVEFTATGESWKEILNKILNPNMEIKQDKFEIDLNKYEMVNNPDGSFTFKEKENVHTYDDVIRYFDKGEFNTDALDSKIECYCKLLYTSLYTNSLFKETNLMYFYVEKDDVNFAYVPEIATEELGVVKFTSKSSIKLALKILGEETIKKALA